MPLSRRLIYVILIILAAIAISYLDAHAANYDPSPRTGIVLRVSDGDTIAVRLDGKETKIRLYGIDAPESKQDGGKEATKFLKKLLLTGKVTVTTLDVDRYDREVALVELESGESLQEMILERGLVWVYTKYCRASFCKDWKEVEAKARKEKAGIWAEEGAVEPWVWRKK